MAGSLPVRRREPATVNGAGFGGMRCGHLFNGIGGFQLAAHWMGWENVFHCEIDEFCNRVVAKRFPESIQHGDIKKQDWRAYAGRIDLLSGGFPCQPVSKVGKRRGVNDDRWLWPEYRRAVEEIQAPVVVVENVPNLLNVAIGPVLDDLEGLGYWFQVFNIPALSVGAYHNRNRIWVVAVKADALHTHADGIGSHRKKEYDGGGFQRGAELRHQQISIAESMVSEGVRKGTDPRIFGVAHGLPDRVDRLRAIGNSICPKVALEIFKWVDVLGVGPGAGSEKK